MVAGDHVVKLVFGVLQCCRILPVNVPIDGDFRPDHQSHAIGEPGHVFAVRIVGEANEVAAQFLCPSQKGLCVLLGEGPAPANGSFFVHGDAAQERWACR